MAYLNKEQYERRQQNAINRNNNNIAIAIENGMTEEQAELIAELCGRRHELHTNLEHLATTSGYNNIERGLIRLNARMVEEGLPQVACIPIDEGEFIEIYSMDSILEDPESFDFDEPMPEEGTDEYYSWYNERLFEGISEWDKINDGIEHYLADIDKKYGTKFCPTGAQRIF